MPAISKHKLNTLRNYTEPYTCTAVTNCEAVTVMNLLPFVWLKSLLVTLGVSVKIERCRIATNVQGVLLPEKMLDICYW